MQNNVITLPYMFEPRSYQLPFLAALDQGKKRIVGVLHRGAGKDLMALNWIIKTAIQKPAVYLHCFPNFSQGKKAIWNSVHNTDDGESMGYLDHIPPELIKSKDSSEMRITFINGSVYCIMGMDGKNANRARGMNPSCVIMSEYAFMDSSAWYTIEPRVSQNNGTAIFLSTPNGQNHFYDIYNYSISEVGKKNGWFGTLITLADTKALPESHIEELRAQGYPEDFIQQEYYCSFTRGAQGSYYGKYIQQAREDNRICSPGIARDIPVQSAWDIGVGDASAIWLFQVMSNGNINFIDYYENQGVGLDHYITYLEKFKDKHNIVWGNHYVPHDMRNRDFSASGISRLEIAANLGYKMTPVVKDGQAYGLEEGIQCVRSTLPRCVFDADKCKLGIKCLDLYCKKYNETMKVYSDEPCHNQWSHGCFTGDIRIDTIEGKKCIKDIEIGDYVLTPNGKKKIINKFIYESNNVMQIEIGNSILKVTPNHKIFTEKGLISADALRYNDIVFTNSKMDKKLCQMRFGYSIGEKDLGFRENFLYVMTNKSLYSMDSDLEKMEIITKENQAIYIDLYGRITMAQFLPDFMSIIKTVTSKITKYLTLKSYQLQNIANYITPKRKEKKQEKLLKKLWNMLKNGMQVMRVENGIENMEKLHGEKEKVLKNHVCNAEKNIKHGGLIQSIVMIIAKIKQDIIQELMKYRVNVWFAKMNLKLLAILPRKRVVKNVQFKEQNTQKVYDIEVEDDHCYYAEGILVSNSDAFRMACVGIKELGDSRKMTPEMIKEMRQKYLGY